VEGNETMNEEVVDLDGCNIFEIEDKSEFVRKKNLKSASFNGKSEIELCEGEEDLNGGHGEIIWSASTILLETIWNMSGKNLKNKRIVELGTGTGVVGLHLTNVGADVILTDQESIINGEILRRNVAMNNKKNRVKLKVLNWLECEDFNLDDCCRDIDMVVASDCYFFSYLAEPFLNAITRVATKNTTIYLANSGRWNSSFFELLGAKFSWNFVSTSGNNLGNSMEGISSEVKVLVATLK